MIRILGTIFAGLLGLAFGSFLNVCLGRWPADESIVQPRSHCRNCNHTLAWWENIPLLSWLALRGRCRKCHTWIGWRYPLVELAVGAIWAMQVWLLTAGVFTNMLGETEQVSFNFLYPIPIMSMLGLLWLLVALAALDAEHLWLPDFLTLPGIALGFLDSTAMEQHRVWSLTGSFVPWRFLGERLLEAAAAAALILAIRWIYWLIRRREGIGLGDAKLMALLAAWLGLPGALLAFALGILLGTLTALTLLLLPNRPDSPRAWALKKLPLGTFLCIGGIISSLWGTPLITAYLRWVGF